MSIETRIQAINDHLIDDYKVLRLAGADLTGVNKNIVNLKMSWKERLLYFMNNGTDDVWNNWTKVNGTGTTLSLNNTEEAPMSLTYKGNTSQNGTPTPSSPVDIQVVSGDNSIEVVGKNLFNVNRTLGQPSNTGYANTEKRLFDYNKYVVGISANNYYATAYIRSYNVSNNNVTINTNAYPYGVGFPIKVEANSTYKLSYSISAITNQNVKIGFYSSDGTWLSHISSIGTNNYVDITTPNNCDFMVIVFTPPQNTETTYSNIMLEKGNTATEYEPYTGASYPISLGVENLFDLTNGTYNSNGVTAIVSNGEITLNGTSSGTAFVDMPLRTNMLYANGATYSISLNNGISNSNVSLRITGTGTYDTNANIINKTNTFTYNSEVAIFTNKITIRVSTGTALSNFKIKPQIEKGTKANSYTPYGKTPIELCKIGTYQDKIDKSTGKNLFDIDNLTFKNGYYNSSGTFNNANNNGTFEFINANPNTTYTFSVNNSMASIVVCEFNEAKTFITRTVIQNKTNATITTNSSTKYLAITINKDGTIAITKDLTKSYQPMLEKNNQTTSYEPYGTGWYLKKEIGKAVLNGNENWNNLSGTYKYYLNLDRNLSNYTQMYSNYFGFNSEGQASLSNGEFTGKGGGGTYLWFRNDSIVNTNDFKTWLGTHNTIVYLPLETPTYTEITDSTLLSQLEALKKSYEGQTNISQVNNDLPFELSVTALEVMS